MDGFRTELLRRLPLVEGVFTLFSYAAGEGLLAGVFDEHRRPRPAAVKTPAG